MYYIHFILFSFLLLATDSNLKWSGTIKREREIKKEEDNWVWNWLVTFSCPPFLILYLMNECFSVPSLLFTVCTLNSFCYYMDQIIPRFILREFYFYIMITFSFSKLKVVVAWTFFVCVLRYTIRKKNKSFHVCLIQYGIRSIMWLYWDWFQKKSSFSLANRKIPHAILLSWEMLVSSFKNHL